MTQMLLESDRYGSVTDQNHIANVKAVVELANAAQISSESLVVDIGAGLGGSARSLASRYGCKVHCVDLSPQRIADAIQLTELVRLSSLLSFECGNAIESEVVPLSVDVIWGQSAWCHFENIGDLLSHWLPSLRPGGCVAVEESVLMRPPRDQFERDCLNRLQYQWKSYLRQRFDFLNAFTRVGLKVTIEHDLAGLMVDHFEDLLSSPNLHKIDRNEVQSWGDAHTLASAGLLGYVRIISRKVETLTLT